MQSQLWPTRLDSVHAQATQGEGKKNFNEVGDEKLPYLEKLADKTWAALCEQLLGYYGQAIAGYNRGTVELFGRRFAVPDWTRKLRPSRSA